MRIGQLADLAGMTAKTPRFCERLRERAKTLDRAACGADRICHVIPS